MSTAVATERSEPNVGGVGEEPLPACLAFVDALPTVLLHADWIARGVMPHTARTLDEQAPHSVLFTGLSPALDRRRLQSAVSGHARSSTATLTGAGCASG